jgi:hypothetical protein
MKTLAAYRLVVDHRKLIPNQRGSDPLDDEPLR